MCVFQAMAHLTLMVLFLWSLLCSFSLPTCQSASPSVGRPGVFWVATDKAQCSNYSNGSDCDTLERYLERSNVNFSLSDTTWIFLQGEHVVREQLNIAMARNVTLTGEDRCAADARMCNISLTILAGAGSVQVYVHKSEQITIKHLSFSTQGKDTGLLRVESTRDFHLSYGKLFHDKSKVKSTHLDIVNPLGMLLLQQSNFSMVNLTLYNCKENERNCTVTVVVSQCRFECATGKSVEMKLAENLNYHSVIVNITNNTTFRKCGLKVEVASYPTAVYSMELNSMMFLRGNTGFNLSAPLRIQGKNYSDLSDLPRALTVFRNCKFCDVTRSSLNISFSDKLGEGCNASAKTNNHVIAILNSHFEHNQHTLSGPFTVNVQMQGRQCSGYNDAAHRQLGALLTIKNSTFTGAYIYNKRHSSRIEVSKTAALSLKNLQGYRVVMAGDNRIVFNEGYGVMLENSQLELHGYNEISSNNYSLSVHGGGIYMSSDSQLLLANNSCLNVSANTGLRTGGGIHVSYAGQSTQTLNEFVDCYAHKLTCPGWCFFQFIDSHGQYVNASDIEDHNATITLSHNTATLGGNVFNGHFQNCSLQTAQGTTPADKDLIFNVFRPHQAINETVIPSFPYDICLCDGDELTCIRNHTLVIETYPIQQLPILVYVKGDWEQVVQVTFTVSEAETVLQRSIMGCTNVYNLKGLRPDSSHNLTLTALLVGDDATLERSLVVKVFNSCSTGLIYDEQHGCVCNAFLKHYKFTCTIRTSTTTYKSAKPHYWIGMEGTHLLFSPNCPSPYCNTADLLQGLTGDEMILNKQCRNGRQGLLCSECPTGYSSVLGSFQCQKCSSVWLLQLPLYAFGGIFVIAVLFLFNLTLLQGTIMGMVLFTNIMGLMADNLQEHTWRPLFFLLSVLNFRSGARLCFFDGMDEFWKALLQFAFPFYLFTLLIVIIIVTHKCGYRMFRKARFIARRAVPVLATIMLLTYTSLFNAAITSLKFTTLYNADTLQGKVVWQYQPSLAYFSGQHLVLGILSLAVTLLYLIPFTLTMLFGDLMRRYFHKLWFSHFMDVFHGAFKWPLGFWIGLRLLLRVILVVIYISAKTSTAVYCTVITVGALLVAQLLVKPFREPLQFKNTAVEPANLSPQRSKCMHMMKKFFKVYHAPLFDTLYMFNVVISGATVLFEIGHDRSDNRQMFLYKAGVNVLILLALVQFAVIFVYHAYNFFPVPEKARSCAQSCWSAMRAIPSMLRNTQCCQRSTREEEGPRRSPTPIMTLHIRPPEPNDSNESESETSSCSEQPPPECTEVRESTLHEPLLTSD